VSMPNPRIMLASVDDFLGTLLYRVLGLIGRREIKMTSVITHLEKNMSARAILAVIAVTALAICCSSSVDRLAASESGLGPATGSPQLVSIQELPEGEMCAWPEPGVASLNLIAELEQGPHSNLFAAFQEERRAVSSGSADVGSTTELARPAARIIRD